jgi:exopolysaccharide biosynthesis polyprenyl glycosylphosphotransferase
MRTLSPSAYSEAADAAWEISAEATSVDRLPSRLGGKSAAEAATAERGPWRRDSVYRRALAAADFTAVLFSLGVVAFAAGDRLGVGALLVFPAFILAAKAVGLYDRDEHLLHKTTLDEVPALFALATVSTLIVWLAEPRVITGHLVRADVLSLWTLLVVSTISMRAVARAAARSFHASERCLVVGDERDFQILTQQLEMASSVNAVAAARMPPLALSDDGRRIDLPSGIADAIVEEDIHRVIVAIPRGVAVGSDGFLTLLKELKSYGVRVSLLPEGPRVSDAAVEIDQLPSVTLLGIRGLGVSRSSRLVKRAFDVTVSALGVVVLSPLMIVIAIAIKLDSRGPILFRQRRVGMRGRTFTLLKFRSMVSEAEQLKHELLDLNEAGPGLFKMANDPRVTRVGRLLRHYSLDELPQLFNVLVGQMSLVGPRPLIREEDGRMEGWHRRRLEALPGITGHWQILHSTRRITLAEMAKLDYLYVANWTLWNDIRLLLRTVPFVVGRRGM